MNKPNVMPRRKSTCLDVDDCNAIALLVSAAKPYFDDDDKGVFERRAAAIRDWGACIALAKQFGVAPLLYRHLFDAEHRDMAPETSMAALRSFYHGQVINRLLLFAKRNEILKAAQKTGISVILLKGGLYAETLYPNIALRPMSDLDILCRPEQASAMTELLKTLGFAQPADSRFDMRVEQTAADWHGRHMAPFVAENGVRVEIHHHLFPGKWPLGSNDMCPIWAAAEWIDLESMRCMSLSLTHQLFFLLSHLHTHAFMDGGGVGLYWFCDLHVLLCRQGRNADWPAILALGRHFGVEAGMRSLLKLLHDHWGSPVPSAVLDGPLIRIDLMSLLRHRLTVAAKIRVQYAFGLALMRIIVKVAGGAGLVRYLSENLFPTRIYLQNRYPDLSFKCAHRRYILDLATKLKPGFSD